MRRKLGGIVLALAALMLTACGQVVAPHQKPLALTSHPAAPSQTCSTIAGSATKSGDLLLSVTPQFVILSRELPPGTPLKPLQIPNPDDTAALNAQLPQPPFVFPLPASVFPGYVVDICNASTTASHLIQGGIVQITSFAPFTSSINTWTVCDGFFTRSRPFSQTAGGCGGLAEFNQSLSVTFPSPAVTGSQATAVPNSSDPTFGPLPVSLAPGKLIGLEFQITVPQAPGTYAFAISVTADHTQLPFLTAGSPTLFAPVAHKFTGAACLLPQMNQQIPPGTTPATFFICPEGVAILPTAAPGRG
jgi:hypothetical protein